MFSSESISSAIVASAYATPFTDFVMMKLPGVSRRDGLIAAKFFITDSVSFVSFISYSFQYLKYYNTTTI